MRIRLPSGEGLRQAGHIGAGLGALLIRPLGPGPVLALVLAALLFNAFILPSWLGSRLRRPGETGFLWGPTAYAAAVAVLLVVFWHVPDVAAAGWLLLAVGDGAATVVGRRWGERKLPWNPDKSWAGSLAYWVAGAAAVFGILWPTAARIIAQLPDELVRVVAVFSVGAAAAALAAAAVESVRQPLDDNLLSPLVGSFVLWGLATAPMYGSDLVTGEATGRLVLAVAVHLLLAWLAWRLGAVTRGAAVVGALLGVLFVWGAGWQGWLMLAALVGCGLGATFVGRAIKRSRGVLEGRRHTGQVLAKGAVPTVAVLFASAAALGPWNAAAAAALAAALADTLASELGVLGRGQACLLPRLRRVAPGTPGAVSLLGTLAAAAGAAIPGAVGLLAGLLPAATAVIAAVAGLVATLLESLMVGCLASRPDPVAMNFLSTLAAALLAAALAILVL
ncbi:MAG: DUF92 domain-containing protein [Thermoanaerobaculia bacterium]